MADEGNTHRTARRIVRRPDDGPIAGVCAGVADYFNVDPAIVRIAAVVLAFTGPGIPAYVLAWIFFPAADGSVLVDHPSLRKDDKRTQIFGIVLIALALSVLWGDWWSPARRWMVPFGLIGVGAWLLLRRDRDDDLPVPPTGTDPTRPGSAPWVGPTTPTSVVAAPPAPAGTTEDSATETDTAATETEGAADAVADRTDADGDTDTTGILPPTPGDPDAGSPLTPPDPPRHRRDRPRRRRFLGPLVFGALLLWGGIAWLAGIQLQDALAIGLCVLGGGFVLGAFVGGSRSLVLPALLVGAALIFTSVVDIPWDAGIGDKRWDVERLVDLDDSYDLGIGEAVLDLSDLDVPSGRHPSVEVNLGIGHLVVLVPDDTSLRITGEVGAGDAEILGRDDDGLGVELERNVDRHDGNGTLSLDLNLGVGHLEVRRAA